MKMEWKDMGLERLMKDIKGLQKLKVTAGYQGSSGSNRVEPNGATTAEIATYNEFGTKDIPARPFMRNALKGSESALQATVDATMQPLVEGKMGPVEAMAEYGKTLTGEVHKQLATTRAWAKPNAASTIAKKGAQYPPLHAGNDRLDEDLTWAVRSGSSIEMEGK